jgi:alpha-galactosidase
MRHEGKYKHARSPVFPSMPSCLRAFAPLFFFVMATAALANSPRINGPGVFGVRPGSPFLYSIPVAGQRPIQFAADHLPDGLSLDSATGQITGSIAQAGEYPVVLHATNSDGAADKNFRIIVGDKIGLAPAMGWNSWNCWAGAVDQDKVLRSARAMVSSGLKDHGWTYINIDDTWQAPRGGTLGGLQGNEKFPDMKALCDSIHAMGLKAGIYSTPWITSYGGFPGGSSNTPDGKWTPEMKDDKFKRLGQYPFAENDARQFAAWGFDYLKYDWNPNDIENIRRMSEALRASGRDIIYSLSNSAPFDHAAELAQLANSWRTTGDIRDTWDVTEQFWQCSLSYIAFSQDPWAPYGGPGHFPDPDMLVVGYVGWGPSLHLTNLTHDEQYTHISMWCMLSAPLLIGCDMERLDPFTLSLLTNDEVLALDQDSLAKPATRVATIGAVDMYVKELDDGGKALAFFNRGDSTRSGTFDKLDWIGFPGRQNVRDLWQQKDLGVVERHMDYSVPAHGVLLLKLTPAS